MNERNIRVYHDALGWLRAQVLEDLELPLEERLREYTRAHDGQWRRVQKGYSFTEAVIDRTSGGVAAFWLAQEFDRLAEQAEQRRREYVTRDHALYCVANAFQSASDPSAFSIEWALWMASSGQRHSLESAGFAVPRELGREIEMRSDAWAKVLQEDMRNATAQRECREAGKVH